jgi:sugar lactone lactonase YvrE
MSHRIGFIHKRIAMRLKLICGVYFSVLLICFVPMFSYALDLEVVAQLQVGPGNVTVTPDKRIIMSLHPFYPSKFRVVELTRNGRIVPFPNAAWNEREKHSKEVLGAVLGIQSDPRGMVWMLDSGLYDGIPAKIVAWDTVRNQLYKTISLVPAMSSSEGIPLPDTAFMNDLAVDFTHRAIFISRSSGVEDSALIIVNMDTGAIRKVLEGHLSVQPEKINLVIDGHVLDFTLPDSGRLKLLIGINPIALDSSNKWLYYGPMNGTKMYRIQTAALLNEALTKADLASQVEFYSYKPLCDGISVDNGGNIYISDLQNNAIGAITPDRKYKKLIQDPKICWPESFSFDSDGYLYFVASKLYQSAPLHKGKSVAQPPFYLLRIKALAPGVPGR